jgi:hypothetical protein
MFFDDTGVADEPRATDTEEKANEQQQFTDKAVVVDGSGYFAALKCRSDFGCVYHEPFGTSE